MKKNLSQTDRGLRAVIGLIILGIGYEWESYWGLVGLIILATSAISFCPVYRLFRFSTKTSDPSSDHDVIS